MLFLRKTIKTAFAKTLVCVVINLAAFSAATAQDSTIVVDVVSGKQIEGRLGSIDFETFVVETAEGQEKIGFDQISAVDFGVPPSRSVEP